MTGADRYDFATDGSRPDEDWLYLGDDDYRSVLKRIKEAVALVTSTPVWAEDFLRVVRAAHLLDRWVSRDSADDNWSRTIVLRIQVADAPRWTAAGPVLQQLLGALTSDTWQLTFRPGAPVIDADERLFGFWQADAVALYSGGLDSSAYAAHHVTTWPAQKLMLVSHDQAQAGVPQKAVLEHLKQLAADRNLIHYAPTGSEARARGRKLESSTRSRGLSFLASAVFAAAAHGVHQVVVPENGQLAINPPLTAARRGACSTRSVHPLVLSLINQLIQLIGGDVEVVNPFLERTKGEVCRLAVEAGLSAEALALTVSCGSHPIHRRDGQCGSCFPCLVRRSGLQFALGEDPTSTSGICVL
ncbi:7-cyano-7-deazaguanine synthase [Kribbella lupini]|uniref:7-cyano-7-deazaguanine synthase in queuosine biosynthesis n=1 Tax=Kribbella lupini TaxID=291602 RepID=A0ABN2BTL3_9ACTN